MREVGLCGAGCSRGVQCLQVLYPPAVGLACLPAVCTVSDACWRVSPALRVRRMEVRQNTLQIALLDVALLGLKRHALCKYEWLSGPEVENSGTGIVSSMAIMKPHRLTGSRDCKCTLQPHRSQHAPAISERRI
jgi:hypothetical protein